MINFSNYKQPLTDNGFTTIPEVYSREEVRRILDGIDGADKSGETFRKSADLFAIRQFLKEVPDTVDLIFNENLKRIIYELFGKDYFVVKSIYFDKPGTSNWFVAWHQDLTISVDKKMLIPGFGPWTVKQQQFAVQPPIDLLESIFTVRIHLDDTDENNGALKVVPTSHLKSIYRPETIDWNTETEVNCPVPEGGIMIMKPLLLHSSGRSTDDRQRRVIHIEFCNRELPDGIQWAERKIISIDTSDFLP